MRIAGRHLLASAQNGGGVAQPLHLIQFVADVEDGAALAFEPVEHDEQLIGFLRRQYRGRLVEDQELWILHQHAHDLDALAFADREPPHFALGIEWQPIVLRNLRQPRRHSGEGFAAVEAERDVFRNGQIVEQREMLKHHADAKRARFRRPGQHDLVSHPAQLAGARLDEAVHHFDQRRFAGAVFAEQRMNLARIKIDIDGVVGEEGAVTFGDTDGLQQRTIRNRAARRHLD